MVVAVAVVVADDDGGMNLVDMMSLSGDFSMRMRCDMFWFLFFFSGLVLIKFVFSKNFLFYFIFVPLKILCKWHKVEECMFVFEVYFLLRFLSRVLYLEEFKVHLVLKNFRKWIIMYAFKNGVMIIVAFVIVYILSIFKEREINKLKLVLFILNVCQ